MNFGWVPPRALQIIGQRTRAKAAAAFTAAAREPVRAQQDYLAALLRRQQDTAFGRAHGFAAGLSPEAYAARVPIMTPDDLRPWVERLTRGERGLLSVDPPMFYGVSSGTSGVPKLIPVTAAYRAEFQELQKAAFWHLYRRFPQAFRGRLLYSVGARRRYVAPDGNDVGAMSGFNFTEQGALVQSLYAWPYELLAVEDATARGHLALLLAIAGDVSIVAGVFPLPIVALLRELDGDTELLAHDLAAGRVTVAGLTAAERAGFERRLAPRPDLARRVREAARLPVEERVAAVLPGLRLVYCWTTATAAIYLPELKRRLGPTIAVRDAIYAATEAWCNVCLGDEEPGGPLAVNGVYYEFIPERDYEAGKLATVPLEGLQDGQRYVIVVSNAAGLYRYVIGDVIETCGRWHGTPRVRFVRKTGATSSLAGELLDESHAVLAVGAALVDARLEASWFAVVADLDPASPGYDMRIELAPGSADVSDERLAALAADADRRMQALAIDYLDLREVGKLRGLRAVRLPQGRCAAWRTRLAAAGVAEAQLKAVPLYGDPARVPEEFCLT